ncbi:MAG: prenyltransferase [Elusimicrobiales bacterium]|nr:prenyltransferase [Elusimicrobiales bacterium]
MELFKKWFIILRAYSWPASVVPMSIAAVYAEMNGWFKTFDFILIFIAGFLIHLAGNLINTYYDYVNGVDRENADDIGIVKNLASERVVINLAWFFLLIASIIGIYFVFKYSILSLLFIGLFGILLTIFYTANPISLKYKAFGELVIFLCFGPLIVSGSVLIFSGKFIWESIFYSLPTAFLIVNILLSNNIRDAESDRKAGIKTIVHLIGLKNSIILYIVLHILSYFVAFAIVGLNIVYFICLPFSLGIYKLIKYSNYSLLNRESAKFVLIFGTIFIISMVW